jgi:hypothetical protein
VITGLVRPRDGSGARVLARIDGAGSSHQIVDYLHARAMSYSVGFTLPHHTPKLPELIPDSAWTPAYDAHNEVRDRAWVAELTDLLDLTATGWPPGMRVIVRKERPHPGAQLRITDVDGHRITAFATNTLTGGPGTELPELELPTATEPGLRTGSAPPKTAAWPTSPCTTRTKTGSGAIVALACEITSWMQLLTRRGHHAQREEPKRLRLRLFSIAGQLATTARRRTLHLATHAPWTHLALRAFTGRPAPTYNPRHTVPTSQHHPDSGTRRHPDDIRRPVTPTQHNHHRTGQTQPDQDPNPRHETSRLAEVLRP